MAEDQAEPAAKSASENAEPAAESSGSKEPLRNEIAKDEAVVGEADVKTEKVAEERDKEEEEEEEEKAASLKGTHVEVDEGSQSINLVLEDTEEIDEAPVNDNVGEIKKKNDKTENAKDKDDKVDKKEEEDVETTRDKALKEEAAKVDAGSSKSDNNEKKQSEKDEGARADTEKVEQESLSAEKVTVDVETSKAEGNEAKVEPAQSEKEKTPEPVEDKPNEIKEVPKDKVSEPAVEDKKDESEEVGIVGPPTAASELLSEAELATEAPALPTDETAKVSERVVRWVEKAATTKANDPAPQPPVSELETGEAKEPDTDEEEKEEEADEVCGPRTRGRKKKQSGTNGTSGLPATRKSQKVVSSIIRRSIRCLNKMHAMESNGGNGKKVVEPEEPKQQSRRDDEDSRKSPKVPQSQQNGAALPEEAATGTAERSLLHCAAQLAPAKKVKKELLADSEPSQHLSLLTKSSKPQSEQTTTATTTATSKQSRGGSQRGTASKLQQQQSQMEEQQQQQQQQSSRETRKRRSAESGASVASLPANGSSSPKKLCLDQREQFINTLIGSDKFTADQLAAKAEQLRAEVQDLDELARAKEMEWNEILSMRKLKEEAYLRIERRRQVMGFMEGNGPLSVESSLVPPASLTLAQQNYDSGGTNTISHCKDTKPLVVPKEERCGSVSRDTSPAIKRERASKAQSSYQQTIKQLQQQPHAVENGPKQLVDAQSPEHRQIGEGRQGPIVDVRSIIADYRLRHPETVPRRRGRRMRNSVNVGLGAGGAMVETVSNMDSRPSSTDSCKSNSNVNDPNNAMSFKDVLAQFAKLSQQQGEPIKTPQNYPDVTLHPVAAAPTTQNSAPQTSGSLLHGILTKSQSPRPTTFSPTLARLLTAPERERSTPSITTTPHQTATQHLLQTYQGANPVSLSDFLSSSKARTEITITPVVNNPIQSHSNNLIHVDDVEEETSIIEERDSRLSMGSRDNRDDRDTPRCQGCHERAAQFVCAGCGNQWYCSRECQVTAWDDHSEACSA